MSQKGGDFGISLAIFFFVMAVFTLFSDQPAYGGRVVGGAAGISNSLEELTPIEKEGYNTLAIELKRHKEVLQPLLQKSWSKEKATYKIEIEDFTNELNGIIDNVWKDMKQRTVYKEVKGLSKLGLLYGLAVNSDFSDEEKRTILNNLFHSNLSLNSSEKEALKKINSKDIPNTFRCSYICKGGVQGDYKNYNPLGKDIGIDGIRPYRSRICFNEKYDPVKGQENRFITNKHDKIINCRKYKPV